MQFLTDNLVWIIVGAVIIVMAIIGYFADKKGFGTAGFEERQEEKPKKEKKNKKKKEEVKTEKLEIPNKPLDEIINERAQADMQEGTDTSDDMFAEQPITIPDDLYAPLTTENVEDNSEAEIPEDLYAPLTTESDDKTVEETEQPVENEINNGENNPETVDELVQDNVEEPVEDTVEETVQETVEEPVQEAVTEDPAAGSEWAIPEEKTEEPAPVVTEEEDIWKF